MKKYYVVNYNTMDVIYSGYDKEQAENETLHQNYSERCEDWYIDEVEMTGPDLYDDLQRLSTEELKMIYYNIEGEEVKSMQDFWDWAEAICFG